MSAFKVHPVGNGNHENLHFLATNKRRTIKFKIVGFLNTSEAYIVSCSIKKDAKRWEDETLHQQISEGLMKWDYTLKTPVNELFKRHENTESVITHFNLK